MAKKRKKGKGRSMKREWTKDDVRALKQHSKAKTEVTKISRAMDRTEGAVRQQAFKLGNPLGHRR